MIKAASDRRITMRFNFINFLFGKVLLYEPQSYGALYHCALYHKEKSTPKAPISFAFEVQ